MIRDTRMTVYSVLGRVKHGESINDFLDDNPDLSRAAIEAGVVYAGTHPLVGRPAAGVFAIYSATRCASSPVDGLMSSESAFG